MNHHLAAIGVIASMILMIVYLVDRGPYSTFAFTFVALPVLAVCIGFYYLREVLRELRDRDVL